MERAIRKEVGTVNTYVRYRRRSVLLGPFHLKKNNSKDDVFLESEDGPGRRTGRT